MLRHGAEHYLYICKAEIRIEDDDPLSEFFELDGQVYCDVGLSDAAFAAGDGYHPGNSSLGLAPDYISELRCLIQNLSPL